MAFFGYIKVPPEAIKLSEELNKFVHGVCGVLEEGNTKKDDFKNFTDMSETLTNFLKSGRF